MTCVQQCPTTGAITLGGVTYNLADKSMSVLIDNASARELIAPLKSVNPVVSETSGRFSGKCYGSLYGWFRAGAAVKVGQNSFIKDELAQFQPTIEGADDQPTKRAIRASYLREMASTWPPRLEALEGQVRCLHQRGEIIDAQLSQAQRAIAALRWVATQAATAAQAFAKAGVEVIYADVMTPKVVRA